ncbi:MAG: phosphoribosylformylglycinamidine synthase [Opitutales bacterium]
MAVFRVFVEKKKAYAHEAQSLLSEFCKVLGLSALENVRVLQRYDVEGVSAELMARATQDVFGELPVDEISETFACEAGDHVFAVSFLPGQFDQRADSAVQCLQLLDPSVQPRVNSAKIYVVSGEGLTEADIEQIKGWVINPVESHEVSLEMPESLQIAISDPEPVKALEGFVSRSLGELESMCQGLGLAMTSEDLAFCQKYFRDEEQRDPTITEIKLLDTYWSDHCRHTTFLTELTSVDIEDPEIAASYERYLKLRDEVYGPETTRPVCLMDLALIGMKALKKRGVLDNLEESEEINAASIRVKVKTESGEEPWLIMFKNETHNHPTEIEPFGGAATCLGGAIRDPLSGRSYVYQAMRITGASDPLKSVSETRPGKLPQRQITQGAAAGYSSYGNQIGLATGLVHEHFHPGYEAKRMEVGAVIAAAPEPWVRRDSPAPGDWIVLCGGRTGRDGIGGATGSSKAHTETALENAAEVQKGNAPTERMLQRLFRNPEVTKLVKKCNDFGAGGISVAIGELADGLEVDLDIVPKKYEGLDGTELALSESQERMAVVIAKEDWDAFAQAADAENLEAVHVATVTEEKRLRMRWRDQVLVDISREFLDSNGVRQQSQAKIGTARSPFAGVAEPGSGSIFERLKSTLSDLNSCSQEGLADRFDSTIGAGSVLHPFGGKYQVTPEHTMAAKVPSLSGDTHTATLMSWGFDPEFSKASPYHGAYFAVLESVSRIVASGGDPDSIRTSCQEYFQRLGNDPENWGLPAAALLGALDAQMDYAAPSIGGKDSMSGSFQDLHVPPTLISFAVGIADAASVVSGTLAEESGVLYLLEVPKLANGLPEIDAQQAALKGLYQAIGRGEVLAARSIEKSGVAATVAVAAFGNGIGVKLKLDPSRAFETIPGAIMVQTSGLNEELEGVGFTKIGATQAEAVFEIGNESVSLSELHEPWSSTLDPIFSKTPGVEEESAIETPPAVEKALIKRSLPSIARPRVLIPTFPGTNCEYDSAAAFRKAGADADIFVFRNYTPTALNESIEELARRIEKAQMIMFPGGFSAGDEPDGSAKFITAIFRNERISAATMQLLQERDGLALGICNGFQALIKLGLVPFGEIRPNVEASPTLTFNTIGRHISRYCTTRIASINSPWLAGVEIDDEHAIPFSHGEGRIVGPESVLAELASNGQIATQYVDSAGSPTMAYPENPNGSMWAIEGLLSPDGRVFGKMGHSERLGPNVGKNIPGEKDQQLFHSGVQYFG